MTNQRRRRKTTTMRRRRSTKMMTIPKRTKPLPHLHMKTRAARKLVFPVSYYNGAEVINVFVRLI